MTLIYRCRERLLLFHLINAFSILCTGVGTLGELLLSHLYFSSGPERGGASRCLSRISPPGSVLKNHNGYKCLSISCELYASLRLSIDLESKGQSFGFFFFFSELGYVILWFGKDICISGLLSAQL